MAIESPLGVYITEEVVVLALLGLLLMMNNMYEPEKRDILSDGVRALALLTGRSCCLTWDLKFLDGLEAGYEHMNVAFTWMLAG